MKYIHIFTVSTLMLIAMQCQSMEINTTIKNPELVAYLHNNTIVIAGLNRLAFCDTSTGICTYHQQIEHIDDLAVNASKTKVATSSNGAITVYDAMTKQVIWQHDTQFQRYIPITFNAQDDKQLISLSSKGKQTETPYLLHIVSKKANHTTPIACHPKEITLSYCNDHGSLKYFHKKKTFGGGLCFPGHSFLESTYNPEGNLLLLNCTNQGCVIEQSNGTLEPLNTTIQPIALIAMMFCSHNVAAILKNNNFLEYWDCLKKELIGSINVGRWDTTEGIKANNKRLALSPDGKLLVALKNKCVIFPSIDGLYNKTSH